MKRLVHEDGEQMSRQEPPRPPRFHPKDRGFRMRQRSGRPPQHQQQPQQQYPQQQQYRHKRQCRVLGFMIGALTPRITLVGGWSLGHVYFMVTDGFGTVWIDVEASRTESDLAASRIEASG